MSKRGPQSELTDRNWDHEEEAEEAGVFKQASSETIQQRVIKKAKRRGIGEDGSVPKPSAFGGFGGLVTQKPALKTSEENPTPPMKFGSFGAAATTFKAGAFGGASTSLNVEETSKSDSKDSSYMQTLKYLNESVLAWIKKHVEQDPYIILTPVFKDYEMHLAKIEGKKGQTKSITPDSFAPNSKTADVVSKPATNSFNSKLTEDANSKKEEKTKEKEAKSDTDSSKSTPFQFGSSSTSPNGAGFKFATSNPSTFSASGFSFGKTTTTASSATSGFSFAQSTNNGTSKAPTLSTTSGFSFGAANSLAGGSTTATAPVFGSFAGAAASASTSKDDDEEYVPPKPEVKEIKEADSVYSNKCKLFFKKEGQWADRGVGNIHLKPLDNNKTQILIRADTNLGNIILNIMLGKSLPMSRQGKNNVLLVSIPNPPMKEDEKDPKPVPMLIRVKSEADADELLAKLEERKKLMS